MSDELIELPEGWVWTKLSELGEWSSGGTPSRKNSKYYDGEIPWVKTGDLPDGLIKKIDEKITHEGLANSSAKLFSSGSLIVAMYGATIGKLGILQEPAATNQACAVLLSQGITTALIPYLFYYLLNSREKLRMIGKGGAQPNISQTILKEYSYPLPPLNEQKRIVAKIEELNDRTQRAKEALETIPQLCDRFRQSVLAAAFRGDLTADWRRQDNEEFLDSNFPSTWKKGELGNVVEGLKQGRKRKILSK
ncbi:MAG: restriction endonuclease subunit S [Nostoc sp. NMS1]|uniref:restriction endonuclease subunit S n=1 Tax=Nostoc sp. NMS1 TaxID=2815388 RepID=UPI0025D6D83D|nr:restriction endonuclease subunit S [Nostoc sp. NMS1]MBN3905222.1 restriction endonuclease subunit S [Nostoc sp. NMS1]